MTHVAARAPLYRLRPIPLAIAATFGGLPLSAVQACTQTQSAAAETSAERSASDAIPLAEVIVTGTRRSDTVQKAPINIFSLSSEQLHTRA